MFCSHRAVGLSQSWRTNLTYHHRWPFADCHTLCEFADPRHHPEPDTAEARRRREDQVKVCGGPTNCVTDIMALHRQAQSKIASDSVLSEPRGIQRRRAIEIGADELLGKVVHEHTHLSRQQTIVREDGVDRERWQFVPGQADLQSTCIDEFHEAGA